MEERIKQMEQEVNEMKHPKEEMFTIINSLSEFNFSFSNPNIQAVTMGVWFFAILYLFISTHSSLKLCNNTSSTIQFDPRSW